METYEPTSRRPIADMFRKTARAAVRYAVRRNIHPDVISYASIAASGLAALFFMQSGSSPFLLLIAPLFCYLRLWFNMLDGMVALASGKASLHGEIVNELPDRISDVLIFAGVAHSGLNNPYLGYWAAIMAMMTAYVGILGQSVGVRREYGGIMSKPWRMVALHTGAWITFIAGSDFFTSFSIMDATLLVIITGCLQTAAIRLVRIMKNLHKKETLV